MKTLIIAGRAILAGILWIIGATAVFIGFLFAAKPIFEPQPNSQGEVAHFLTDIILVFILTIVAIVALTKANRKVEAISVMVTGLVVGGYMAFIFVAFGGLAILLGQ